MIPVDKIRALTVNPRLLQFVQFLADAAGDAPYPDYRQLDLMQIAPLVQHVWALDFRRGIDPDPLMVFSGTHIDAHYEMNITGKTFRDIYVEDDFDDAIVGNYYQVYLQKKISYTRRLAHYFDDRVDRYETIEAMLFPCSADGITIDYGIGYVEYTLDAAPPDKVFQLI